MKIAIGYNLIDGPWGGGNSFANSLRDYLTKEGHSVIFDLKDKTVDIILLTDPRPFSPSVSFSSAAIIRYLLFTNKDAIVIHRVNECDERKNTNFMNKALIKANWCADHTVFVGTWLTKLPTWKNYLQNDYNVILNGSNKEIFHSRNRMKWNNKKKLKIVTHHWGGNFMKGFDIYSQIDEMLTSKEWKDKIDFTYIGNLPKGFKFKNVNYVFPLTGEKLSEELKKNHLYITASQNEPGGNHQNEAGLCGLPILYRNSGCLPEYCKGYGIEFTHKNFVESLIEMMIKYEYYFDKIQNYPHSSDKTCKKYLRMFKSAINDKQYYLSKRKFWSSPFKLLKNILFF